MICRKSGLRRFGGLLTQRLSQARAKDADKSSMEAKLTNADVTREEFDELMAAIDQGLRALPATGQVGQSRMCSLQSSSFFADSDVCGSFEFT